MPISFFRLEGKKAKEVKDDEKEEAKKKPAKDEDDKKGEDKKRLFPNVDPWRGLSKRKEDLVAFLKEVYKREEDPFKNNDLLNQSDLIKVKA